MCSNWLEDSKLFKRLNYGDEQAFRLIYEKYHKPLFGLAFKYLQSKELAEDAVHDIFIKVWSKRKKLDSSGTLKHFLFTVTKNHVLNVIMLTKNKQKLNKRITLDYETENSLQQSDNVIILSEYRELYKQAIEQLPHKRQQIYKLKTKDGLTYKEIAQYLGLSEHTIKSQHNKASNFIRDYVQGRINRKTGT